MATVHVDNRTYDMDPGQNLLHGCLQAGMNLPYFCWHPALGSVGACRQCAVKQFKDESDQRGKIVMACMTPASEGTRISIEDPEAVAFRKVIIEGLMLNHPHDCPVCDEGGECHLQDMTVMTGHDYRRYEFEKRTFRNQYLGPFVNHEMNRCIQCYRCVRYYREYAGGTDLNAFALRDLVFFGREGDGVLESEFAGNLAEICPTGVFTDATLKRHYTRKWDLEMSPSVCVHCGLGCNTTAAERYGEVRRIVNRYNGEVNGYFLCDRGRFGYEFVNSDLRIRRPMLREKRVTVAEARDRLRELTAGGAIGIGSPRASLESNFALRELVGESRFFAGIPDAELRLLKSMLRILREGPARTPSLREIEAADAVLVLGEDVTNTAPRMALALRQAVRNQPMQMAEQAHIPLWMDHAVRDIVQDALGPLYLTATGATRLDDIATRTFRAAPDDQARLGFAVANALDGAAPAPASPGEPIERLAAEIAGALKAAKHPLIVSGAGSRSEAVIQAAANVAWALPGASLAFAAPEWNSFGLAMMDAPPLDEALEYRCRHRHHSGKRFVPAHSPRTGSAGFSGVRACGRARLCGDANHRARRTGTADRDVRRIGRHGDEQRRPRAALLRGLCAARGDPRSMALARVVGEPGCRRICGGRGTAAVRRRDAGSALRRVSHGGHENSAGAAPFERPDGGPGGHQCPRAEAARRPRFGARVFHGRESGSTVPPPLQPFFWAPGWNSIQAVNKFQEEIAGPLRGGDAGVRTIRARREPPALFRPHSRRVPTSRGRVAGGAAPSYLRVGGVEPAGPGGCATRARALRGAESRGCRGVRRSGGTVRQALSGSRRPLGCPRGVAGIPAGVTPFEGMELPAWSKVLAAT